MSLLGFELGNFRFESQCLNALGHSPHIFFIYFLTSNCLWYSFLYLKIVKIRFHRVPPSVHSPLANTWILKVKSVKASILYCKIFKTDFLENTSDGFFWRKLKKYNIIDKKYNKMQLYFNFSTNPKTSCNKRIVEKLEVICIFYT